jgi:hypothetical protein
MGAGEMSREGFTAFLQLTLGHAAVACRNGAIAFVCMDWRHLGEVLAAGEKVFSELKNVCVWNKTNGHGIVLSEEARTGVRLQAWVRYTPIHSDWVIPGVIARMCGITPA